MSELPDADQHLEAAPLIGPAELRVAVLSDALQNRNGVDAYYRDLVSHLRAHVASIELLSPNPTDGDLNTPLLRMPLPGDTTQNVFFPQPSKIRARTDILRPNVIVSATNGPFGMYGVFLSKRLGTKLVAGFHTHIEELCDMYWGRIRGWITRTYMESQNKILFRSATHVVVNSHSMVEPAQQLSDTPVTLMGTPLSSQFVDRPITPIGEQLASVFYGGRLAPEKNVSAILEAARMLPDIHFTIAGDGPQREEIEAEAAHLANLTYAGLLPRESMAEQIDRHDLLVLPSHLEAFGTIALEAMIRERLVLVSSACGILSWKALARGLYSYSPEESLTDAIRRIATLDTRLRQTRAKQAREAALEIHEHSIQQWLELLVESVNSPA